nr:MAG: BspA type Leucine rich repeat region protein [Bacteriophage sp.]
MIIDDIVTEVTKIQNSINAIKEALKAKGVTSEGRLNKFAEEIKKINGFPYSDTMLVSISNAINLGLTDEEVTKAIAEFTTSKAEINLTDTVIPNNKYKDNKNIKPIHVYFRATAINNLAFNGSNLKKITAPLVTKIAMNAFENCSELEELSLGSYNYQTGLNTSFSLRNCRNVKKLILGDNSNIIMSEYNKLAYGNPNIEIYTNSGKKYNKNTFKFE